MLTAEVRELNILMEIKSTLMSEEASFKRVKADGVREAIAKISNLLNIVLEERPALRKARRMLVDTVKTNVPPRCDTNILTMVTESLARQEAGLATHSRRLEKMEGLLISQTKTVEPMKTNGPANVNQEEWSEVVKRPPKNNGTINKKETPPQAQKNVKTREKPPKTKNPAILFKTNADDFPALARRLKTDTSREVTGDRVLGMRKTRSGDMIIEINGDSDKVEEVRKEIARVAGAGVSVSSLTQRGLLEIRDIDSWSEKCDVLKDIVDGHNIGLDSVKVISIRKAFGGTQTAVVLLPMRDAVRMSNVGSIKIGFVKCRVRLATGPIKCFRCLGSGHMSSGCTGPDRQRNCRRYGLDGHLAKECGSSPTMATAFREQLQRESSSMTTEPLSTKNGETPQTEPSSSQHLQ